MFTVNYHITEHSTTELKELNNLKKFSILSQDSKFCDTSYIPEDACGFSFWHHNKLKSC